MTIYINDAEARVTEQRSKEGFSDSITPVSGRDMHHMATLATSMYIFSSLLLR